MVSNSQAKFIKSLKIKKYRTRESCFLAEGKKNVLEAFQQHFSFKYFLATEDFLNRNDLPVQLTSQVIVVSPKVLSELGTFQTNHDCLAVLEMPQHKQDDSSSNFILALDGLSDPGNLGTIIRTMDWFGLNRLICSDDSADFYNPKVINATMGSFTRVSVQYVDLVSYLKEASMPAYGADMKGTPIKEWQPKEPIILVMGSESHGIRPEVKSALEGTVTIPSIGQAESLNVAIASGILLNHLKA